MEGAVGGRCDGCLLERRWHGERSAHEERHCAGCVWAVVWMRQASKKQQKLQFKGRRRLYEPQSATSTRPRHDEIPVAATDLRSPINNRHYPEPSRPLHPASWCLIKTNMRAACFLHEASHRLPEYRELVSRSLQSSQAPLLAVLSTSRLARSLAIAARC